MNGVEPQRPTWARQPTITTVELVAAGRSDIGNGRDIEIGILRNEATGLLCFGEAGGFRVCGPEAEPGSAWERGFARYCHPVDSCPGLILVDAEWGGMAPDGRAAGFGWGVFRRPVESVRVRAARAASIWSAPKGLDRWLDPDVYELPARFGGPFRVFIYGCTDCATGHTFGFNADGEEVAHA